MDQNTSLIEIKGIGEKTKKIFDKLNIFTVKDLLQHYPKSYDVMKEHVAISMLVEGEVCAIYGMVCGDISQKKIKNLTISNFEVKDQTGKLQITIFNMPYLKNKLFIGSKYLFRGLVHKRGTLYTMEQPQIYSYEAYQRQIQTLQPKYALTKGLSHLMIQKAIKQVLSQYVFEEEYFPQAFIKKYELMSHQDAITCIHFPENYDVMISARKRLVFEEFFSFLFMMYRNKEISESLQNEYPMYETVDTIQFINQLPFALTNAQKKAWQDIKNDMGSNHCMNRLIQGDVGSGKTIVALLALLMCAAHGNQGALMAPTEVLAIQHYENICNYIKECNLLLKPLLLVGSMSPKEKRIAYEKISTGQVNLVIGTHTLIQNKVNFYSLALVVTDEQHRFGVRQRTNLVEKGKNPHVLVMSATPIPRTLAIILYGDLQISIMDELPAERLPIKNCVVNTSYREKAYRFIEKEVSNGRQAYVICSQVEEGELEAVENVVDYSEKLKTSLPSYIRISYLHGKMRAEEKKRIMKAFSNHEIDVLVSTTVIEVGINVPNATVMMVENAERFGLATLHQLRGRVGRGEWQSYCIFISTNEKKETMERLQILNHSNDGFLIASEDLRLRGPGDLFGIRQSGEVGFNIADLYGDVEVLKETSEAIEQLWQEDPELEKQENQALQRHFTELACNYLDIQSI